MISIIDRYNSATKDPYKHIKSYIRRLQNKKKVDMMLKYTDFKECDEECDEECAANSTFLRKFYDYKELPCICTIVPKGKVTTTLMIN